MSNRVEWALAGNVGADMCPQGTEIIGYEEPVTADWGLLLDGGSGAFMIEGTKGELLDMLAMLTREVIEA